MSPVAIADINTEFNPYSSITKISLLIGPQPVILECFTPTTLPLTVSQLWSLGFRAEGYKEEQLSLFSGSGDPGY